MGVGINFFFARASALVTTWRATLCCGHSTKMLRGPRPMGTTLLPLRVKTLML